MNVRIFPEKLKTGTRVSKTLKIDVFMPERNTNPLPIVEYVTLGGDVLHDENGALSFTTLPRYLALAGIKEGFVVTDLCLLDSNDLIKNEQMLDEFAEEVIVSDNLAFVAFVGLDKVKEIHAYLNRKHGPRLKTPANIAQGLKSVILLAAGGSLLTDDIAKFNLAYATAHVQMVCIPGFHMISTGPDVTQLIE